PLAGPSRPNLAASSHYRVELRAISWAAWPRGHLHGPHGDRSMPSISYLALSGISFVTAAGVAAAAIDGPVGRDAEKGDPARWYEPADTPQEQYRNAMQEAEA